MTERRQDILLGGVFAAVGSTAALMAAEYPGASGIYPTALGCVVAGLGALVAIRAVLRGADGPRALVENAPRAALTLGLAALYLVLVPVLGFYLASALLVMVVPLCLGFRRPLYSLVSTGVFIGIVWLVFSVVLEKPLPAPVWLSY
ncbi:conserved hypothetical protein [Ruegeria sp. TrichCH4B]|nr:conserved hypothetical protein [Ruegeria sp. TrichCH4B]